MLLSTIISLYALALVQAIALPVDISSRDIDTDCILEPNSTTIWYKDDGLAKPVSWNTGTTCVNNTMPDSGTISLIWLDGVFIGLPPNNPNPDWKTPAIHVNLGSGQTTVHLPGDVPTGSFILSLDWSVTSEDGTITNGSHESPVFQISSNSKP